MCYLGACHVQSCPLTIVLVHYHDLILYGSSPPDRNSPRVLLNDPNLQPQNLHHKVNLTGEMSSIMFNNNPCIVQTKLSVMTYSRKLLHRNKRSPLEFLNSHIKMSRYVSSISAKANTISSQQNEEII